MSKRVLGLIILLLIISVALVVFVVLSVQVNTTTPGIAKTAESISNATLIATLKGGS